MFKIFGYFFCLLEKCCQHSEIDMRNILIFVILIVYDDSRPLIWLPACFVDKWIFEQFCCLRVWFFSHQNFCSFPHPLQIGYQNLTISSSLSQVRAGFNDNHSGAYTFSFAISNIMCAIIKYLLLSHCISIFIFCGTQFSL